MATSKHVKAFTGGYNHAKWYHGTNIPPAVLGPRIKNESTQVIRFLKPPKIEEEKGVHITPYKEHASYFATHWHDKKSGYLYSFPKPKTVRVQDDWGDHKDALYTPHSVKPTHVQTVSTKSKYSTRPSNYTAKDFKYGPKKRIRP